MSRLSLEASVRVAAFLVEGASVRAIERQTGVHRDTILRLLLRLGAGCDRLHDRLIRGVYASLVELDEVWCFIAKKQSNLDDADPSEFGDAYTFIALDHTSRLLLSYRTDKRTRAAADAFCADLRSRVVGRPQINTDGWNAYPEALETAFGVSMAGHGIAIKEFAEEGQGIDQHRYSPGRVLGVRRLSGAGNPDLGATSTSYVERNNLTIRMHLRRFTRLTNGFSRRLANLRAAVALHAAWYNLVKPHAAHRVTPAMQANLVESVWSLPELVEAALSEPVAPATPDPPVPVAVASAPAGRVVGAFRVIDGGRR